MKLVESICVVGAGGWGTALSVLLAGKGHEVRLWARRPELAEHLSNTWENRDYLSGIRIPETVRITSDLGAAVSGSSVVLITVISAYMASLAGQLAVHLADDQLVVHGSKGLDPSTLRRGSEVLEDALGSEHRGRVAALSGPNLSREVAVGMPTATVVACPDEAVARRLQGILSTRTFRVYTNTDIIGVELCGAVKNIVALAAGMADGFGYGDNSKAAIITRTLAEIGRLVQRMGGHPLTVAGLAGIGDIIATCNSRQSRNRAAGEAIARGRSVAEIQASSPMVAEGIPSTDAIYRLAERNAVEMPITRQVRAVLFEGISPQEGLAQLLGREFTSEPWM